MYTELNWEYSLFKLNEFGWFKIHHERFNENTNNNKDTDIPF